ncbi:VPLPA-CTERM sorting domain-containing protein [Roseovarius sp. A21]|uniref:VPLPA-CTERM sorting domain-containing protein n=1 Tax=Roseovarius bejariae TaxID=2576383 RepID=A0A844CEZ6_9RHOB|nr:VPLPA-CTERM sorting domain-containing protein [Roseovarius bejariae]MRU13821.1 VPLPA-CTERM sorting domain-containing protein [Roseovarius bejariae]
MFRSLVLGTVLAIGCSAGANAAVVQSQDVTVDGVEWRVSIQEADSFLNQRGLLEDQTWWGLEALAYDFASSFGSSDDHLNSGFGAYFAYAYDEGVNQVYNRACRGTYCYYTYFQDSGTVDRYYATAEQISPVPLPASLPLLLAGAAGLAGIGRFRKKRAAQA